MAHIGKAYPVYNPFRIVSGACTWPFYLPTEFAWTGTFECATASPVFQHISGREMLPAFVSGPASPAIYAVSVPLAGGPTVLVRTLFDWVPSPGRVRGQVSFAVGGVEQVSHSDAVLFGFPRADLFGWSGGTTLFFLPASTVQAIGLTVSAVTWSARPQPPLSRPF